MSQKPFIDCLCYADNFCHGFINDWRKQNDDFVFSFRDQFTGRFSHDASVSFIEYIYSNSALLGNKIIIDRLRKYCEKYPSDSRESSNRSSHKMPLFVFYGIPYKSGAKNDWKLHSQVEIKQIGSSKLFPFYGYILWTGTHNDNSFVVVEYTYECKGGGDGVWDGQRLCHSKKQCSFLCPSELITASYPSSTTITTDYAVVGEVSTSFSLKCHIGCHVTIKHENREYEAIILWFGQHVPTGEYLAVVELDCRVHLKKNRLLPQPSTFCYCPPNVATIQLSCVIPGNESCLKEAIALIKEHFYSPPQDKVDVLESLPFHSNPPSTQQNFILGGSLPENFKCFQNIQLGTRVTIKSDYFVDQIPRDGYLWWIGRNDKGEWFGVVETAAENSEKVVIPEWKSHDGVFFSQRLWHVQPNRIGLLVSLDTLMLVAYSKRYSSKYILSSFNGNQHLGCRVHVTDRYNKLVPGRLLWSGLIDREQMVCILLERTDSVESDLSSAYVSTVCIPGNIQGCHGYLEMKKFSKIVYEENCSQGLSVSHSMDLLQEKKVLDFIEDAGSFTMCEIPSNENEFLHKIVMGNIIHVDGGYFKDKVEKKGRICWLGRGDESGVYFGVVQIDELTIQPIDEMSWSMDGHWNGQTLFHNRNEYSSLVLVPIDYLVKDKSTRNYGVNFTFKGLGSFNNHLGCEVRINNSQRGYLLWSGVRKNEPIVCVKLIGNGASNFTHGGADLVSTRWSIRGCNGGIVTVPAVSISFYDGKCSFTSSISNEQVPVENKSDRTKENKEMTHFVAADEYFTMCQIPRNENEFLHGVVNDNIVKIDGEYFKDNKTREGRIRWIGTGDRSGDYFTVVEIDELNVKATDEKYNSTDGYWNKQRLCGIRNDSSSVLLVPIKYLQEVPGENKSIETKENKDITHFIAADESFTMCEIPRNENEFLHRIVIGNMVKVNGEYFKDNQTRNGRICWLGKGDKSGDYFSVVEIDELNTESNDDKCNSTDGCWNKQRLFHIRNNSSSVLLVPIKYLHQDGNVQKYTEQFEYGRIDSFDHHLGCEVIVNGSWKGCLVWSGSAGKKSAVCIKEEFSNVSSCRDENRGREFVNESWIIPGYYGRVVIVDPATVTGPQECHVPTTSTTKSNDPSRQNQPVNDATRDPNFKPSEKVDDARLNDARGNDNQNEAFTTNENSGRDNVQHSFSSSLARQPHPGNHEKNQEQNETLGNVSCTPNPSLHSEDHHENSNVSMPMEISNPSMDTEPSQSNPTNAFIALVIPDLPLGATVSVRRSSRQIQGTLRWIGKRVNEWMSVVEFPKGLVDEDVEEKKLFNGFHLPKFDETSSTHRLVHVRDIVREDGTSSSRENVVQSKETKVSQPSPNLTHKNVDESNKSQMSATPSNQSERFILDEVPQLQGVRLGDSVFVRDHDRNISGILRWKGTCGDKCLSVVEFKKDLVDVDPKRELFDGFHLPQYDERESTYRIIDVKTILPEPLKKVFRYSENIRVGEVLPGNRNHLNRQVMVKISKKHQIIGKLIWTGYADGTKIAVVVRPEGEYVKHEQLVDPNLLICSGVQTNEMIVVDAKNVFLFEDVTEVSQKQPPFFTGDMITGKYDGEDIIGRIDKMDNKKPSNGKIEILDVVSPIWEKKKNMGKSIKFGSVNDMKLLSRKVNRKDIPPQYSICSVLNLNVEMKFVDKNGKKWIGQVKWIGIIDRTLFEGIFPEYHGDHFAALEVDGAYNCPIVAHCDSLRTLLGWIDRGRAPLFVPIEYVDPVYQHEKQSPVKSKPVEVISRPKPPPVYFDIPHSVEYFQNVIDLPKDQWPQDMGVNYPVEVHLTRIDRWRTGVCKWIGKHTITDKYLVGVELDEKTFDGSSDGVFPVNAMESNKRRLFQCRPQHGIVVPLGLVREDRRNVMVRNAEERAYNKLDKRLKEKEKLSVSGDYHPIVWKAEMTRGYGIQGKTNSCYMDSTLLALYAMNESYDFILEPCEQDENSIRYLLKNYIVNPLRQDAFVRCANTMYFREKFEEQGKTQGMTSDQKDAEEFLTVLFERLLKIPPLLEFTSNDTTSILQLFFMDGERCLSTTKMLQLTLGDDKFRKEPFNLIMLIPREGSQYIGFKYLQLDLELDVGPFVKPDSSINKCCVCQTDAKYACLGPGDSEHLYLCEEHLEKREKDERWTCQSISPKLELFAVLCIQVAHYVTFLREKDYSDDKMKWYFFDSMADRAGDANVPQMEEIPNMETYVKDYNEYLQKTTYSNPNANSFVRRLFGSAYVLFYRNSRLLGYN